MSNSILRFLFVLPLTFLLISCNILKEKESKETFEQSSKFYVIDNQAKVPISLASVTLSVDKNNNGIIEDSEVENFTTDESGVFQTQDIKDYKRILKINAYGYIPLIKTFDKNEKMDNAFYLKKLSSSEEVQITKTSSEFVAKSSNIEVIIPSSSKAFSKTQNVSQAEIGYISPGKNPELMPANFKAYWNGPSYLSSTGAFYVRFYDDKGWPVELPEGDYKIKVKVSPEDYSGISDFNFSTPEIEIPLWYLNEKEGLWEKAEELGYLVDESGNKVTKNNLTKLIEEGKNLYVTGEVKHFSFINCDIPTKPAAICGRLKGIDNCKDTYIEITGVNWNGGQGGNKATENCYFCVPVPHDLRKVLPKLKDCDKEIIRAYLNWGDDIINLIENGDLVEKCEKQWENVAKILKDYGYRLYEYLNSLSNSKGLSETDRDSIRKTANKFKELIDEGRFNEAFKYFENVHKIFVSNEKISAEDFEKAIKEMQKKAFQDLMKGIGDIFGIDLNLQVEGIPGPPEVSKLGNFFKAVAEYGSSQSPCLSPVFRAVGDVAPGEITDVIAQIMSKGRIETPLSDKVVGATMKFVGSLLKNMVDEQTGGLNQDFLKCLEQNKNLAKFAKAFKATNLSKTLANKLGVALIYANILATGIQIGFDIYDADVEIRKKELALKWDTANYLIIRALSRATNTIEPECRPDNFTDLLSSPLNYVDLEALSNTCSNLKSFIENYQKFVKNEGAKEITGLLELKETVEAIDSVYILNTILNAITGGEGFYNNWFSYDNLGLVEELPPVSGNFGEFGGYLSQLNISIPDSGVDNIPVSGLSSEGIPLDLIPSPKVPAETPSGIIGAWIGDVDLTESLTLTEVLLKFSFELPENVEINKVKSFYIRNKYLINPKTSNCWIENSNVFCKFSTYENILNYPTDINISVSFKGNKNFQKDVLTFQLKDIDITSSREFKFDVYLCDFYKIKSINVPDVLKPESTYNFSTEIEKLPSLSKDECYQKNSNPVVTWYIGSLKIGNGNSTIVKTPSREQMFYLKNEKYVYAELKDELHKERKSKTVDIQVVNSKPDIISFNVPEKISADKEIIEVKAEVKDNDGDNVELRWFSFPLSILSVEDGLNEKTAKIKVQHMNKEGKGRICLKASDFASSSTKCSDVIIEKRKIPPKILSIEKVIENYIVPTTVHFKVKYASYNPIEKVNVTIEGPDGTKNLNFPSTEFNIDFKTSGDYSLKFKLLDSEGSTSNEMELNLHFYNIGTVNIYGAGSVLSYSEKDNLMEVKLSLSGISDLTVLEYKWDLNSDGIYDVITDTPEITFKVSPDTPFKNVNVRLETPLGHIDLNIPSEKVEPLVILSGDKRSGTSPLTVNFNVYTYGVGIEPKQYKFDFDGDGVFDLVSENSNVSYIYENPGVYECFVEVLFSDGSKKGAVYKITVNYEGFLSIYKLEYPAYGELEYVSNKLFAHLRGDSRKGYLLDFDVSDGIYLNKAISLLKDYVPHVSFSPLSDGFIVLETGSICVDSKCSNKANGTCFLRFGLDKNLEWKKCFKQNYSNVSVTKSEDTALIFNKRDSSFAVVSLSDGNILASKEVISNGIRKSFDLIYPDKDYFYIFTHGGKGKLLLIKVSKESFEVSDIKSIDVGYEYFSTDFVDSDGDYIYFILSEQVQLARHSYVLFKFNKNDLSPVYSRVILYKCPWYCYGIADLKINDDNIFLFGYYSFWGGDGQRIIKLNKENGNLIFARKLKVCETYECTDTAQSLTIDDSWIYVLGEISSRDIKGFYISALTKDGSGCSKYIESVNAEDIGFDSYNASFSVETMDTSLIEFKDKELTTFDCYIDIQDATLEILEHDSCR